MEQEALRITDNVPKNEQGLAKIAGKWRPTGNIQVYDDVLGRNVPVVSVNVRTRNWFRWWDGYTDINGNFRCSKEYLGDLAYSLRWHILTTNLIFVAVRLGKHSLMAPTIKRILEFSYFIWNVMGLWAYLPSRFLLYWAGTVWLI